MIPRNRLDIELTDLLYGFTRSLFPPDAEEARQRIAALWSPEGGVAVCLSVRSGFDALLAELAFPPGSEILVSALTIRDMVRIIGEHGLVAVPVDLDTIQFTLQE